MGTHNFIYAHNQSAAFPVTIFIKTTNAQQHYVPVPYNEFHPNQTINVESTDTNSFTPISRVWLSPRQFSQNSELVNIFHGYVPYRILSKLDETCRKRAEFHSCPSVKYAFHCSDFSQNI
jgi:hypothetical protein